MTTPEQVRHQTVMDDEARQVARVYAEALYKAAESRGEIEAVLADFDSLLGDLFARDRGLLALFQSAAVTRDRKADLLGRAFGSASETVQNFLGVLNNHNRLDLFRPIAQAFRALCDRKNRRVVVQVISAVTLTDDERRRVCDDVRSVANVEPILQETIDPDILGGLIVRINDWVYDASVRTRLETIRAQLIERSSHGIESGRDRFGP